MINIDNLRLTRHHLDKGKEQRCSICNKISSNKIYFTYEENSEEKIVCYKCYSNHVQSRNNALHVIKHKNKNYTRRQK